MHREHLTNVLNHRKNIVKRPYKKAVMQCRGRFRDPYWEDRVDAATTRYWFPIALRLGWIIVDQSQDI